MDKENTSQKVEPGQSQEYSDVWHEVGKQAETLAESLTEALKLSWEKASHEARPHLLSLLREVSDEVQKMIHRLEQPEPVSPPQTEPEAEKQPSQ